MCKYRLIEYRIEDLARTGGVAVDTIRFYQGKHLIDPPRREGRVAWYSEAHLQRLNRIKELHQRGFALHVIRRFLDGELAASDEALVEAVTTARPGPELTLEELAQRSGVAISILRRLAASGLLLTTAPRGEEERYPASDLEVLGAGLKLVQAGIPVADLIDLGVRHAQAVEQTALEAVELFDRHVRKPLQSSDQVSEKTNAELLVSFEELLAASATLVRHHFAGALLRAARERIERPR
ncbi:MAG: MerR family transcriptional regulator [Candidatus Dormibacteraceae bacterium]